MSPSVISSKIFVSYLIVVVILVIPFPVKFEIFFNDSVIKTSSPAFKFCLSAVAVKVAVKFPSAANAALFPGSVLRPAAAPADPSAYQAGRKRGLPEAAP